MTYPEGRTPLTFDEPPLRHWSTWQAEVEELRRDYSLLKIDRNILRNQLDQADAQAERMQGQLAAAQDATTAAERRADHLRAVMGQACRLFEANAAPSAYKVLVDAMRESEE